MTSICLTLEFLKFKIVKSKKQATKKNHNHIITKSIPLLLKRKPHRIFNFQFTVTNMMTKSKQYFTKNQTISYFPLLRLRKDYSVGKSKLHSTWKQTTSNFHFQLILSNPIMANNDKKQTIFTKKQTISYFDYKG